MSKVITVTRLSRRRHVSHDLQGQNLFLTSLTGKLIKKVTRLQQSRSFMDVNSIVGDIETAVMAGRTDVVRAALTENGHVPNASQQHINSSIDSKLMDALNTVKPSQGTMLHMATKQGNADVVRALLVSEVDASIRDENGATAFQVAETAQVKAVFYDVLLQAVAQSKTKQVEKLIACGLDVNYQDSSTGGNSILHWAALYGNKDTLKILLDAKCNVNAINSDGVTPLHEAVERKDAKLVEELLVRGADPNLAATSGKWKGQSPKSLATSEPAILALMENASKIPLGPVQEDKVPSIDEKTPSEISGGETEEIGDSSIPLPSPSISAFSPVKISNGIANPSFPMPEPETTITDERLKLLWPKPQWLTQKEGPALQLPKNFAIKVISGPSGGNLEKQVDIWTIQTAMLQDLGLKPDLESGLDGKDALVVCLINKELFQKKESYRIVVTESQVKLICSDVSGLWYASCTFLDLVRLFVKDGIPQLKISDWPNLAHRGVMLDMSAGRLLTIDYLLFKINTLSLLKFNELHFYIKIGKESTLENLFPYLPSELLDMEVYCNYRFMSVVPYIDAAEDLELTPQTFDLFRQVLSLFSNNSCVNIGPLLTKKLLTENVKLGSASEESAQPDWQVPVTDKLRLLGMRQEHTILFCTNEMDSTACQQFPLGSIGVQYGTRNTTDFVGPCKKLFNDGVGFIVSPGTATWNSIGGSPEVAIRNILNATQCAATNGDAVGLLVVSWAGKIHLDHLSLAWPGLVTASTCAWNTHTDESHIHSSLAAVINNFVFRDPECTLGNDILNMGKACTLLNKTFSNAASLEEGALSQPLDGGSFLCQLIYKPDAVDLTHMTADVTQKVMLAMRRCQASLKKGSKEPLNASLVIELYLVSDFILWGAKLTRSLVIAGSKPDKSDVGAKVINPGIANLTATTKTDCANKLLSLMEEYRHVWLKTCNPSGLLQSLSIFSTILDKLVPSQTR